MHDQNSNGELEQAFRFDDDTEITVLGTVDEPLFIAAQVARALGYRDAHALTRRIDAADRGTRILSTPGGPQEMTVINEAGLYIGALGATVERAREFKRWVTHTVLPEIRRTGSFGAQPALPTTRELAQMVLDAEDARDVAERQLELESKARRAMESYAKDLEPRAEGYDRLMDGDGTYAVGAVAKMIGTSQNKLWADLRAADVMIAKGAMRNTPYQRYMHHFDVKAYEYTREDGSHGNSYRTRVRPSGIDFICRKLGRTVAVDA